MKTLLCLLIAFPAFAQREDVSLRAHLAAEGVDGTVAIFDTSDGVLRCSRVDLCVRGFLPASTFKVPNTLISLETGVADGPDFALPWDGQKRRIDSWNHDHTLRSALRDSVVWYYQELARRVGEPRMKEWVQKLGYGNHDISGGVDLFWLDGALRISPIEQIEFLRRLAARTLPASVKNQEVVAELMLQPNTGETRLHSKTGWSLRTNEEHGWWVGWATRGERTVFFAVLLTHKQGVDLGPKRRAVGEHVLHSMGMLD
jgi:beta-lactamase class D